MYNRKIFLSSFLWGLGGVVGISILLYGIQFIGMLDILGPWYFFLSRWYFIMPLILGFGIQLGIFRAIHMKTKMRSGMVIASGGVSSGSMLACCLHNFTALIPLLGFAGIAAFFAEFQDYIFSISIAVNLFGIFYLWRKYKKIFSCHNT